MITNEYEFEQKFKNLLTEKELKDLQSISIFQTGNNCYEVFNTFKIFKKNKSEITVYKNNNEIVHTFFSLKNALCWCIYEKRNKFVDADRIILLDSLLSGIDVIIEIHKKLLKKANKTEDKLIYLAKLNEDKFKKSTMITELDNYLSTSRVYQQNQFRLKTIS